MTAEVRANTLFVTAQGASLRMRELSLQVVVDGKVQIAVPLHHLHAVAIMGPASITTAVLSRCVDAGISVTFLTASGKLLARIDAPVSGNVLLRRRQFRQADDAEKSLEIARSFVAGKLTNCRSVLTRASRDASKASEGYSRLQLASNRVRRAIYRRRRRNLSGRAPRSRRDRFTQLLWCLFASGSPLHPQGCRVALDDRRETP